MSLPCFLCAQEAHWVSSILGLSHSATLGWYALIYYCRDRPLIHREIGVLGFLCALNCQDIAAEGFGQSLSSSLNAVQAASGATRILDVRESWLMDPLHKCDSPATKGGITIGLRDARLGTLLSRLLFEQAKHGYLKGTSS